mgnify:CR=1 FL=1
MRRQIALAFLLLCTLCTVPLLHAQNEVDHQYLADSLRQEISATPNEANVLRTIALARHLSNPDSTIHHSQRALQLAENLGTPQIIAHAALQVGRFYRTNKQAERALPYLERAANLGETNAQIPLAARAWRYSGHALMDIGRTPEAQEALLQALRLSKEANDSSLIASTYASLGEVGRYQHDAASAIKYYQLAEDIYRAQNDEMELCRMMYDKAIAYKVSINKGDLPLAIALLDSILRSNCFSLASRPERLRAITLTSKGSIHAYLNQYDQALQDLEEGLAIKKVLNDSASLAYSYNELATLNNDIGNYSEAVRYGEKALQHLQNRQDVLVMSDILRNLAQAFDNNGQYQEAYDKLNAALALKDSVVNQQKTAAIIEMEAKYKTAQKEEQIAQAQLELALQSGQFDRLLLIASLLLLAIGGISLWYYLRLQQKTALAKQAQELEHLKNSFIANISHEFRTPLSLIIGPLQKLRSRADTSDQHLNIPVADVQLMTRNADRLQQLINQLLDLSRLDMKQMQLNLASINLSTALRGMVENFASLAEVRRIRLRFENHSHDITGNFDSEKIQIIINNLLSNALKFTPPEGTVSVGLKRVDTQVQIRVIDDGPGIEKNHLPHIFKRFYQVDDSATKQYQGSGIGLALTKELVETHRGQLHVQSEWGKGTTFTILLPLQQATLTDAGPKAEELVFRRDSIAETENLGALFLPNPSTDPAEDSGKPNVLIVEDNPDLRFFIRNYLKEAYHVLEASDGAEGLRLAREHLPDLIISDIMMPGRGQDGLSLCRKIKGDLLTCHIPVVLLTAKAAPQDRLLGLEHRADAYLVKPFDPQLLLVQVTNLIQQRRQLKVRFAESIQIAPEELAVVPRDRAFIQGIMDTIEAHLADENFGVNELGHALNMDRTNLYRKIKALTNDTPSVLLRKFRLQRARQLLEQRAGNVSEVSQMVGYRNSVYFSQVFKKEFGVSPVAILKKTVEP